MRPDDEPTLSTRVRVRSVVGNAYQIDRRDGLGYVDATKDEYDHAIGHAWSCPFHDDDADAEDCPW